MKIDTNFSELNLFFNQPIHFIIRDDNDAMLIIGEFDLFLPTFQDMQFNINMQMFLGLLNYDFSIINNDRIHTLYDLLEQSIIFPRAFQDYYGILQKGFQLLHLNFTFEKTYYALNGCRITVELWNLITDFIAQACCFTLKVTGNNKLDQYNKKIARLKQQKTTDNQVNIQEFIDLIVGLYYELHMSDDEILHSTMYKLQTLASYYGHIIQHQLSLVAVGNGLSKKIHTITRRS